MPPKRKREASVKESNKAPTKKQRRNLSLEIKSPSKFVDAAEKSIPKKRKSLLEVITSPWSTFMPPEILFRIFTITKFNSKDLRQASQVCWSWNACLKDEAFGWALFVNFPITFIWDFHKNAKNPDRYSSHISSYLGPDPTALKVIQTPAFISVGTNYRTKEVLQLLHEGEQCALATIPPFYPLTWLTDLENDIFEYEFVKSHRTFSYSEFYQLYIKINYHRLENKIRKKQPVPIDFISAQTLLNSKLIEDCAAFKGQYLPRLFNPDETFTPTVLPIITEQPKEIINVTLHQYQIEAINWMINIEKECHKGFSVSPLIPLRGGICVNPKPTGRELVLLENAAEHNLTFTPKGGVIADEMGLGKTVEVIGLILSNPKPDSLNERDTSPYFASKATLVLCPNQLVHQWNAEIEKYSEKKLTVIQLTTIVQVKKYTYEQIMDADVVLVTHNLLRNNNYIKFAENWRSKLEKEKDGDPSRLKGVILNHFHWYRIVMDEGHEIIDNLGDVTSMKRDYNWYMTGTPFPTLQSLEHTREFLGIAVPRREDHDLTSFWGGKFQCGIFHRPKTEVYVEAALDDIMINNLVWRNTKKSVKKEYQMVKTKRQVILLSLTPTEKAIYHDLTEAKRYYGNIKTDPRRLLCTKLDSDWGTTLTEIRQFWLTKKKEQIAEQTAILKELKQDYKDQMSRQLHHNTLRAVINRYNTGKYRAKGAIEAAKKLLEKYEAIDAPKKLQKNSFDWLLEHYGTKTANLIKFLRNLFEKDETARAIVFSQFPDYLKTLQRVLEDNDIQTSNVKGNVHKKSKELDKFKAEDSDVKVVLLSLTKVASGMNLIEASHVILMDPHPGTREEAEAYETQAVGRAYRQGQTKDVTVIRFIIKDSVEHTLYVRNCANEKEEKMTLTNTPSKKLVRSNSFGVLLANNSPIRASED